jgi:hypothetical protein
VIRARALALVAVLALAPVAASAWEATTTHVGLTEQAALASALHERLQRDFGLARGLYEVLELPPGDAPALAALLRRYSPSHGFAPDARGRQSALGWLLAGSAIADRPASHFANHFLDRRGRGLDDATLGGPLARIRLRLDGVSAGGGLPRSGVAAPAWLASPENPMGLAGFWDQYDKAVSAATPGERARHLAGALIAAGAVLHVLEDMGSPSHVRNDLAAHAEPLSSLSGDRGSRFERLAALAYGRAGVPPISSMRPDARPLAAYLTAKDGSGLADRTAARFASAYTLPEPHGLERDQRRIAAADLGLPPVSGGIDLVAAKDEDVVLRDPQGVCLATYRVLRGVLRFELDDACALEQIAVLLPETGAYAAAMLDTLFRGSLAVTLDGGQVGVAAGTLGLGAGTLTLYWDDARGVRAKLGEAVAVSGAAPSAALASGLPALPGGATRVVALFKGVDANGEPLSATGAAAATP